MTTTRMFCVAIAFMLVAIPSYQESRAFESGDQFVTYEMPTRLMRRYEQMGGNENVTYPAHIFNANLTDAQAERVLETMSVMMSTITAAMYGTNGFKVRSVEFTLESNGRGAVSTGDPVPFNINAGANWWGMGYKNNQLGILESWARNPNFTNHPLWHELAHFFQGRHLDEGDGWWTRSNMNGRNGDVPPTYSRLGGDDLAAAMHMWRYAADPNVPMCPEFHVLRTRGVCPKAAQGCDYPNVTPYPEGTWGCDPDREDHLGLQIRNEGGQTCVTVDNGSNGTPISSTQCDYTDPAHTWDMLADNDGAYRLRNTETGKCMQLRGPAQMTGTVIEQADCNGANSNNASQKFYPFARGGGHYSLRLEASGQFLEADADGIVQQYPDGDLNQRWSLSSCGDGEVQTGETCEQDADCNNGGACTGCQCEGQVAPPPAPPAEPAPAEPAPSAQPAPPAPGEPAPSAQPAPPAPGEPAPSAQPAPGEPAATAEPAQPQPGAEPVPGELGAGAPAPGPGAAPVPAVDPGVGTVVPPSLGQGPDTEGEGSGCACSAAGRQTRPGFGLLALLLPLYLAWCRHRRLEVA